MFFQEINEENQENTEVSQLMEKINHFLEIMSLDDSNETDNDKEFIPEVKNDLKFERYLDIKNNGMIKIMSYINEKFPQYFPKA